MAKQSGSKTSAAVRSLIAGKIAEMGYYLWDVEYVKEGAYYNLIVTIDKEEGISLDDCEAVTRAINPILDEADPIADSYYLEVSSAGLERELKCAEHFEKCIGMPIRLGFFAAVTSEYRELNGQKSVEGILAGYSDGVITVRIGENDVPVKADDCSYVRTVCE
ncbi:MAG: ribosome maturation factor RimP [Firmicutes bacterium]|nr:ribosome maturation factor RimP [Bacillota bacterium]